MKLFKNVVALCLAALMIFGAGATLLLDAFGTAGPAVTAEAASHYFSIWYKVGDGPEDDDLETVKEYYDEDDVDDGVEILGPDDVWNKNDYKGWTFLYWEYQPAKKVIKVYPGDEVDGVDEGDVMKLTAVWEESGGGSGDFKVTYKIGDAGDANDVVKYVDGDFKAPDVSKIFKEKDYEGYEFDCWEITKGDSEYEDETYRAGKTIPEEAFNSKDQLTLTALWDESDTCTVKYASGNSKATGTTPATKTVDYGESITLPSNPYTLTGYTFAGWDVDGSVKKAGDKVTVKKNLTITATWAAAANVTLTYGPGKGAGTSYTKTYTAGTSIKLDTNSFTRDGYNFIGWWIGSVSKTFAAGTSVTINGNDTATAQWTAIATSQPATSQPATSVPESSSEAPSEPETSSEPEESEPEPEEEETDNILSYTISGETPVSGISAELDDDIGNAQLWVTAVNGSNASDNTTAALIDSGDAVAAFDLSLLVDGSTYSDAVSGTVSFEMQGSAEIAKAPYDEAVIAMIHVVGIDKFDGKGYYRPDGKKVLYFNSRSGEESEVNFFGFKTENGVNRIFIKDSVEAPDEFAYLSDAGTVVEVRLIPNANADTFNIDFTSLSPFLIAWVEINEAAGGGLPLWVWIAIGGGLIFAILVVVLLVIRGRNAREEQRAAERLTRREAPQKAMPKEAAPAAPHFYNDEGFERASDIEAKKGFDVATAGEDDENYRSWNSFLKKE